MIRLKKKHTRFRSIEIVSFLIKFTNTRHSFHYIDDIAFVKIALYFTGCNPHSVFSILKDNGTLTVTAPRDVSDDTNLPNDIPIPIKLCGPDGTTDPQCTEDDEVPIKSTKSLCDYYLKEGKPKDPKSNPSGQD